MLSRNELICRNFAYMTFNSIPIYRRKSDNISVHNNYRTNIATIYSYNAVIATKNTISGVVLVDMSYMGYSNTTTKHIHTLLRELYSSPHECTVYKAYHTHHTCFKESVKAYSYHFEEAIQKLDKARKSSTRENFLSDAIHQLNSLIDLGKLEGYTKENVIELATAEMQIPADTTLQLWLVKKAMKFGLIEQAII